MTGAGVTAQAGQQVGHNLPGLQDRQNLDIILKAGQLGRGRGLG